MDSATVDRIVTLFIFSSPILAGFFGWVIKKWVEQVVDGMNDRMEKATYPIQANANGGNSLPDLIKLTKEVLEGQGLLHEKVNKVITDVAHLTGRFDNHIEEER